MRNLPRRRPPALPRAALALVLAASLLLALLAPAPGRAEERSAEQDGILALIAPRRSETIADVGSGRGAWTFPLARAVGSQGKVYAVDIDPDALSILRARMQAEGVTNVEVIHSVADDPMLPVGALDAVFLNDVIDHVERPAMAGFLAGIRQALKPDGRLVIRDPSGAPDRVIAELYRSGFALVEAKVPMADVPARSFSTGWYALRLRKAEAQHSLLPRLGRPERHRTRLHLAEELFRHGLLTREELRAKWESIRDARGEFDPAVDEARDLVAAARCLGMLSERESQEALARISGTR